MIVKLFGYYSAVIGFFHQHNSASKPTMPLYLDFYVLHSHVYLIHERHQIPSDKPHRQDDDADVHPHFLVPWLKIVAI
jgi:hypothetical protein